MEKIIIMIYLIIGNSKVLKDKKGDFYEGILMMHPGDSASFVVRADSTYIKLWKLPANNIKPSDVVRFDISIVSKEDRVAFGQKLYEKKKTNL